MSLKLVDYESLNGDVKKYHYVIRGSHLIRKLLPFLDFSKSKGCCYRHSSKSIICDFHHFLSFFISLLFSWTHISKFVWFARRILKVVMLKCRFFNTTLSKPVLKLANLVDSLLGLCISKHILPGENQVCVGSVPIPVSGSSDQFLILPETSCRGNYQRWNWKRRRRRTWSQNMRKQRS